MHLMLISPEECQHPVEDRVLCSIHNLGQHMQVHTCKQADNSPALRMAAATSALCEGPLGAVSPLERPSCMCQIRQHSMRIVVSAPQRPPASDPIDCVPQTHAFKEAPGWWL